MVYYVFCECGSAVCGCSVCHLVYCSVMAASAGLQAQSVGWLHVRSVILSYGRVLCCFTSWSTVVLQDAMLAMILSVVASEFVLSQLVT
jgi:hypothetical protein